MDFLRAPKGPHKFFQALKDSMPQALLSHPSLFQSFVLKDFFRGRQRPFNSLYKAS